MALDMYQPYNAVNELTLNKMLNPCGSPSSDRAVCKSHLASDKKAPSSPGFVIYHSDDSVMRKHPELLKRLENVEKRVEELASLTANHLASVPALIVGWSEISQYCRKPPRTLSRYAKGMAFPAFRWARHVVSSPAMIDRWLLAFLLNEATGQEKNRRA